MGQKISHLLHGALNQVYQELVWGVVQCCNAYRDKLIRSPLFKQRFKTLERYDCEDTFLDVNLRIHKNGFRVYVAMYICDC